MLRRLPPRLGDFVFVCVFAACLLLGRRMLNIDSDLGRHLALGTYMLDSRSIPVRDILSFSKAGAPRPPYEWLAQIIFAFAHRLLGLDGVVLVTSALIGCAFLLAYLDARQRSDTPLLAMGLTLWAAAASSLHWLTRPHVFSFILLVIWLRLLERLRLGNAQAVWQLPLLMLVWANLHGGFVVGFLALAAYTAGWLVERWKEPAQPDTGARLLRAGLLSLAASFATPDLWNNWAAVLRNRSTYLLSRTAETMPVNLGATGSWPFLGLLGLGVLLAILSRRSPVPSHSFVILGFAALAVAMARNIPLFSLAATPILASWSAQSFIRGTQITTLDGAIARIEAGLGRYFWPPLAILIATALIVYHSTTTDHSRFSYAPERFPVQAVDWLEIHPIEGNMLNELDWGGYLLFRLWPVQRIFVDSQTDFYGEQFIRQYVDIMDAAPGWEAALRRYEIDWVLISPRAPLTAEIQLDPEWRLAYQDGTAVIFVRKQAPTAVLNHSILLQASGRAAP